MFDYAYLIEVLTPLRRAGEDLHQKLDIFAQRYRRILNAGCGVSIPDNPMGRPRLSALETIEACGLTVKPRKLVMNLNTFHTKEELDNTLAHAAEAGVKYLLIVRGDGGPELPRLDPKLIGGRRSIATSVDLLHYINAAFAGVFITGAAFNHYNPIDFETDRLKQKIDAGARFVITQPVVGEDPSLDRLKELDVAVVIEAWMSSNVELLFKSVRRPEDDRARGYDPVENLKLLHSVYPQNCIYLSMLSFQMDWQTVLPRLSSDGSHRKS